MRFPKLALTTVLALFAMTGGLRAQSTTGSIGGRVNDVQGGALPGVAVSVESPNLQGVRTVVTSEQGDYVFPLLPSGTYLVTFELDGFERTTRTVPVATTHHVPLDVTLGLNVLKIDVTVTAQAPAEVLTKTAQVALNLKQDLIAALPNNRDISAALTLAPSVHTTGAAGGISIAGSMSFQNLFLMNGVTINENLRGQPNALFIEDAIQETTVATGGISAEFGRFSGGVVNVVTKSGGNQFSGSFRESLNNDKWRAHTPFEKTAIAANGRDTRLNDTVPTHEYTLGGPVMRDKLWFFTAGRVQTQAERRTLAVTNIPYDFKRPNRRYEGKATYSPESNHRLQGTFTTIVDNQEGYTFNPALSMDTNSLGTREQPQKLYSLNYSGVVSPALFVEALWSRRNSSGIGVGARSRDLIDGTLLVDRARGGTRYWSDTFCGVCSPERRDNENVNLKASYFLSSPRVGTHNMTFGYDNFNDMRSANNYQSGSDYRILGTTSILRGAGESTVIYPQFLGDGTTLIQWNPIPVLSNGNNFRTHALFYNDSWRVNGRLTANLGVRYDKNHGRDQEGKLVVTSDAISPRLGMVFDPTGSQKWSVSGSVAQFVDGVNSGIADASSTAGNSQAFVFAYRGPSINADPNAADLVDTRAAIARVFDWYNANGGATLPYAQPPNLPGVSTKIGDDLKSPRVMEYASGVSRQFNRGSVRVDYVFRNWSQLYIQRTNLDTGRVANALGQQFDVTRIENSSDLTRRYSGATFQGTYRLKGGDAGATYTLSRLWGNNDGESRNAGPTAANAFSYPEYKQASWNFPEGDLAADQRHRARFWVSYSVPRVAGLSVSGVQWLESGLPYGAVAGAGVDPRSFVANPGYVTPPSGNATAYFFTARDAFRTEGQKRFDFAATYKYGIRTGGRTVDVFFQTQVLNLFDNTQLCACGGTVFQNGGAVDLFSIDQTVRTAVVPGGGSFATFDPFTTTPTEGVNWAKGPNFGNAVNRNAWTSPRQLRLTFGVRF